MFEVNVTDVQSKYTFQRVSVLFVPNEFCPEGREKSGPTSGLLTSGLLQKRRATPSPNGELSFPCPCHKFYVMQ